MAKKDNEKTKIDLTIVIQKIIITVILTVMVFPVLKYLLLIYRVPLPNSRSDIYLLYHFYKMDLETFNYCLKK